MNGKRNIKFYKLTLNLFSLSLIKLIIFSIFLLINCGDDEEPCEGQMIRCDGECTSTGIDVNNCGECGIKCDDDEICSLGFCKFSCNKLGEGLMECPLGSGICRDIKNNNDHCGYCDRQCDDTQYCLQGECTPCPEGNKRCTETCIDVMSNQEHCGDCNKSCSGICESGVCYTSDGSIEDVEFFDTSDAG